MATTTKKYMSLERLTEYDGLIKAYIDEGDASAKSYTDTKISAVNTSITNITNGDVVVKEAEHATSADSATSADTAANATTLGSTTADTGSTTKPIYLKAGVATAGSTYAGGTKVTLNGSAKGGGTASFYAPTGAGTSGYVLTSAGSGAPTWADGSTVRTNIDVYSTTEVDTALSGKSDTSHNHDSAYDAKGAASTALSSAKTYADTNLATAKSYADSGDSTTLASAKTYADEAAAAVKDALLNGAGSAYDTLKELGDLIDDNVDAIDALEAVAAGKADASHTHTVSEITDLTATATELNYMDGVTSNVQTQLDSKSTVEFAQSLTSGTQVGTITIDGTATKLYAPTNTDTKNTAGSSNTSSKIFLIGATSQATNPQTYSHDTAYVGTDGCLYSNSTKVSVAGHTHTVSEVTDLTATAAELNILDGATVTASELNVLDGITATTTELNYMDGVTSNVQTQLDAKQATITGGATTITSSNLTASRALISNSSGKVAVSAVTSTELGYLDGVTSAIQTQLDGKSSTSHTHSNASTSAAGFMSATDKAKLDGIATGATAVTVDSALSSTSTNPVQNKIVNSAISTATSAISANTSSITALTTRVETLETSDSNWEEITSAEVSALFA